MADPVIVQFRGGTLDPNCVSTGNSSLFFIDPTLANNGLFLLLQTGVSGSYTVSDDQSQSWTKHGTVLVSGQQYEVHYKANSSAGVRKVTMTLASGTNSYMQYCLIECYNTHATTPIDTIKTMAIASAPNLSFGSMTIANNNSLVISWCSDVTNSDGNNHSTYTAGTGGTLLYTDQNAGTLVQMQDANAGSFTPNCTVRGTHAWSGMAIAIKGGTTSGTAPSTGLIRIRKLNTIAIGAGATSPFTFNTPRLGNLLVVSYIGQPATGGNAMISTLALDGTNMTQAGSDATNSGIGGGQIFYKGNLSASGTSSAVLTATRAFAASFASMLFIYDIENASSSPYDNAANSSGTQSSSGNLTTVTITPNAQPGLAILVAPIDSHTLADCTTPSTYRYDGAYQPGTNGGDTRWAEADGWAHTSRFTSTSALTFTFTTLNNSAGVQAWAGVAATFLESAGSPTGGTGSTTLTGISSRMDLGITARTMLRES